MRRLFAFIIMLLFVGIASAQENSDFYAYQDVINRIETARASGSKGVNLSNMGLTVFPPELLNFYDLESLDLSQNQLTSLPREIVHLENLSNLKLSSNQLSDLPALMSLLPLSNLDLSHNQLTALPMQFGNLSSLRSLDLSYNYLTALPANFANLTSLCYLNLTGNQFATFPAELEYLPILTDPDCYEPAPAFSSHAPTGLAMEGYIPRNLILQGLGIVVIPCICIAWVFLKFRRGRNQKSK